MDESPLIIQLWLTGTLVALLLFSLVLTLAILMKRKAHAHRLEKEKWYLEMEKRNIAARLEERDLLMDDFSKEIHDNIGQLTNMVGMYLHVISQQSNDEAQRKTINGAMEFVEAMQESIHKISYSMEGSHIHEDGLFNAIGWQIDHIRSTREDIEIRLESADMDIPLSPNTSMVVYRIAQEAINNALTHSGATEIIIRLHYTQKQFTMEILDDGKGLHQNALNSGKIGIKNMKQRARILAGQLEIRSIPEMGTNLKLMIPIS